MARRRRQPKSQACREEEKAALKAKLQELKQRVESAGLVWYNDVSVHKNMRLAWSKGAEAAYAANKLMESTGALFFCLLKRDGKILAGVAPTFTNTYETAIPYNTFEEAMAVYIANLLKKGL